MAAGAPALPFPPFPPFPAPFAALSVDPFDATSDPTDDLPWNGADDSGHFTGVNAIHVAGWQLLRADDHHLVARRGVEAGDVGHQHVHTDRSDHGRTTAANEDGAPAFQAGVQSVRIPGRNDGNGSWLIGDESHPITHSVAGSNSLHGDDLAAKRHRRRKWDRGCERWWHDSVQQQARANPLVPHA